MRFLCVGFLYAQIWKDLQIPTKDEWMVKLTWLPEMMKLTILIKENTLSRLFFSMWKLFLDFLLENGRNEILMLGFDN